MNHQFTPTKDFRATYQPLPARVFTVYLEQG